MPVRHIGEQPHVYQVQQAADVTACRISANFCHVGAKLICVERPPGTRGSVDRLFDQLAAISRQDRVHHSERVPFQLAVEEVSLGPGRKFRRQQARRGAAENLLVCEQLSVMFHGHSGKELHDTVVEERDAVLDRMGGCRAIFMPQVIVEILPEGADIQVPGDLRSGTPGSVACRTRIQSAPLKRSSQRPLRSDSPTTRSASIARKRRRRRANRRISKDLRVRAPSPCSRPRIRPRPDRAA